MRILVDVVIRNLLLNIILHFQNQTCYQDNHVLMTPNRMLYLVFIGIQKRVVIDVVRTLSSICCCIETSFAPLSQKESKLINGPITFSDVIISTSQLD